MQRFCDTCGQPSGKLKYCSADCRPTSKDYRAALRAEFIAAYGGKCACCGEAEPKFLELDHVFGGGEVHRRGAAEVEAHQRRGGGLGLSELPLSSSCRACSCL